MVRHKQQSLISLNIKNHLMNKKQLPVHPLPIIAYGDRDYHHLRTKTAPVAFINQQKTKSAFLTLKVSAGVQGSYCLAANQIGLPYRFFTIKKDFPYEQWFD